MAEEKGCCCCCGGGEKAATTEQDCTCEQGVSKEFLASLEEDARALILDDSTAPELISAGSEVFAQGESHQLSAWTRGVWELYKELIRATIDGGWDNETHPWNRDMQDFWKYPLAFTSYGLPSLVMVDPSTYEEVCEILRKSLLLMKDAGAFDEWTIWWFVGEGPHKSSLKIRRADMGIDMALTKEFVAIGFPYFALQVASSAYTAVVNNRLAALGSSMDLAVFAIINGYVIYVLMLFVAALTYATQAIASFNNGARRWDRLAELVRVQLVGEVLFMAACSALVMLFPRQICTLFAAGDTALVEAAAPAVRLVVALCALGYTGQMMSSYFECVGLIGEAIVCGIALYVIFTIPLVYILGATMGIAGVWWAQLVANLLAGALSILLARREIARLHGLQAAEGNAEA